MTYEQAKQVRQGDMIRVFNRLVRVEAIVTGGMFSPYFRTAEGDVSWKICMLSEAADDKS